MGMDMTSYVIVKHGDTTWKPVPVFVMDDFNKDLDYVQPFNYRNTKFFRFLQGEEPIIVGDMPYANRGLPDRCPIAIRNRHDAYGDLVFGESWMSLAELWELYTETPCTVPCDELEDDIPFTPDPGTMYESNVCQKSLKRLIDGVTFIVESGFVMPASTDDVRVVYWFDN